jgi:transcriptional regulator with AAA-type ATPase domain/predicted ATPase
MSQHAGLLGESRAIETVRLHLGRLLERAQRGHRPPTILLQGETGTGKGLVAQLIHAHGVRRLGPFVEINCAAVPETLLEAEFFGFERGAFTDARQAKTGLFQAAHQGVLFLDEVALLPPSLQPKLLTAIEQRVVRRLGSTKLEPADVWLISATNTDLQGAVRGGRFRADLYHRLSVFTIELPPLRTREGDIIVLAEHFLARACADYGLPPRQLAPEAREALLAYPWPGNVRELQNIIERTTVLVDRSIVTASDLDLPRGAAPAPLAAAPVTDVRAADVVMREHLARVLTETGWNIARTAALLGVTRNTVMARIRRHGLRGPRKAGSGAGDSDRKELPAAPAPPRAWRPRRLTFLRAGFPRLADDQFEHPLTAELNVAADKLRAFGGRIEGIGPSALNAIFGLEPRDEPALLATHGAIVVRNALRQRAPDLAFALHTEEVMVQGEAAPPVLEADRSRRVWNRLEALLTRTSAGDIALTSPTAELVNRRFTLLPLGADTETFLVDTMWHARRAAPASMNPLVGRRGELALLAGRLALAREGHGQVVALAGDAGIGKSRILSEAASAAEAAGMRYLEGRCVPAETQTALYPFLQLLREACGIAGSDTDEAIRDKIDDAVRAADVGPAELAAALRYLLGAEPTPPDVVGLALTKRLFLGIERLLVGLSRRRPLVIGIEDLHWIDATSNACLTSLLEVIRQAPIALVTTYRPDFRPGWIQAPHVAELRLAPLDDAESITMIRAILALHGGVPSERVERDIQTRAQGNPLFLEELSRASLRDGRATPLDHIPATVTETIAARLDALPPGTRRLLTIAAVIGPEDRRTLLDAVAAPDGVDVAAGIATLQGADLLRESTVHDDVGYRFKHALVCDVAYATLSPDERRAIHASVLRAMQRLYPDRVGDHVERLAHHAVKAEQWDEAVDYLSYAGRKSVMRAAYAEAIGHLTGALASATRIADADVRRRKEIDVHVFLGLLYIATRGWADPETERVYVRARALSEAVGDTDHVFPVLWGIATFYIIRGRTAEAVDAAARFLALSSKADQGTRVVAEFLMANALFYRTDLRATRAHLGRSLALFDPARDARLAELYGQDIQVTSLSYLGMTQWLQGEPDQAVASAEKAVQLATERKHVASIAYAHAFLLVVLQLRGDLTLLERAGAAIAFADEKGLAIYSAFDRVLHGWAVARDGRREDGHDAMRRALDAYAATGAGVAGPTFHALLALVCLWLGRPLDGLKEIVGGFDRARSLGTDAWEPELHRIEGELHLALAPAAEARAEQCFEAAIERARQLGTRSWELRAATSLAQLLHRRGNAARARETLAAAYGRFTEGFYTPDLRAARALLDTLGA